MVDWALQDLAKTLKTNAPEAGRIIELLQIQGYVKPSAEGTWLTSIAGENVSGSVTPRFARDSVENALSSLKERIKELNRDAKVDFVVSEAVAFGDFLGGRPRVQAADVGLALAKKPGERPSVPVGPQAATALLKKLKNKSPLLHVRPFEEWMGKRTHLRLL